MVGSWQSFYFRCGLEIQDGPHRKIFSVLSSETIESFDKYAWLEWSVKRLKTSGFFLVLIENPR